VLFPALSIVPSFITSMPERRVRIAFVNSNTLLWLVGAWLYVAIPSLGPAYSFPAVWLPLAPVLTHTQFAQHLLIENYAAVRSSMRTSVKPINIFFGVAAFPSLHVGFQVLTFLWMRRLTRWGVVFGVLTFLALIGSIVTGWHYLIDGIAGGLLAWACYAAAQRVPAIRA
jgi:membrane-associated phospholipid phosphatase